MRYMEIVLPALVLASCSKAPEPEKLPSYPIPQSLKELKAKVGSAWNWTMASDKYPDTLRQYGQARFDKANSLLRWAAVVVAERDDCDQIDSSDLSDNHSSKDSLGFNVNCTNGNDYVVYDTAAQQAKSRWEHR